MSPTGEKTVQPGDPPRHACVLTIVHQPFDVRIFHKQARTLAAHGWRVTLIAPGAPDGETVDGVTFLTVPKRARWRRPQNWGRMLRLALGTRADVYHTHDPELLIITALLRLLTRRPVIYDVHEDYALGILEKHWIPKGLRGMARGVFEWCEARLLKAVDAVVFVTPPIGERYKHFAKPSVQVANFALRSEYPDAPGGERQPGLAVCVGGMRQVRGYDSLLDAFCIVLRRIPSARLMLVGNAETTEYGGHLRDRVRLSGMEDAVEFTGQTPFRQVRGVLARASVGLLPYLPVAEHMVAYPTKLFEYMAAGVPCVCSNLPLLRQIVEEAGCGLIVDPADPDAVAEAIVELLQNRGRAQEMGERGRQAFLEKYNWQHEGEKLLELYERLCPAPRPAPRED